MKMDHSFTVFIGPPCSSPNSWVVPRLSTVMDLPCSSLALVQPLLTLCVCRCKDEAPPVVQRSVPPDRRETQEKCLSRQCIDTDPEDPVKPLCAHNSAPRVVKIQRSPKYSAVAGSHRPLSTRVRSRQAWHNKRQRTSKHAYNFKRAVTVKHRGILDVQHPANQESRLLPLLCCPSHNRSTQ